MQILSAPLYATASRPLCPHAQQSGIGHLPGGWLGQPDRGSARQRCLMTVLETVPQRPTAVVMSQQSRVSPMGRSEVSPDSQGRYFERRLSVQDSHSALDSLTSGANPSLQIGRLKPPHSMIA